MADECTEKIQDYLLVLAIVPKSTGNEKENSKKDVQKRKFHGQ